MQKLKAIRNTVAPFTNPPLFRREQTQLFNVLIFPGGILNEEARKIRKVERVVPNALNWASLASAWDKPIHR